MAYPVRAIFGQAANVNFRFGRVTGVDWDHRLVTLEGADPLPFDSIIVASGATARFFGIPGAAEFSFPLYTSATPGASGTTCSAASRRPTPTPPGQPRGP